MGVRAVQQIDPRRRALMAAAAGWLPLRPVLAADAAAPQAPAEARKSRLILLGTVGGASYVVDCGNGVARQLILAKLKLASIRDVFITHHHSDHDADFGNLLWLAWATDLAHRVDAYGPPPLSQMWRLFLQMNDVDIRTRIADEGRPALADLVVPHELTEGGLVMQDENVKVTAAVVDHPPIAPALAFRFDCPDRSIVISGDTRPSPNLVKLAHGADVLVHEVMHLPSIEALIATETNAKTLRDHLLASHTTTEQVGKLATEAGVKTLVLSHFVPGGYPFLKDEVWYDAVRPYFSGELVVGRDLLEL